MVGEAIIRWLKSELNVLLSRPYSAAIIPVARFPTISIDRDGEPFLSVWCRTGEITLWPRRLTGLDNNYNFNCDLYQRIYHYEDPDSLDNLLSDLVDAVCWTGSPECPLPWGMKSPPPYHLRGSNSYLYP